MVTVFRLVWADGDAEEVLDAWQAWLPEAPDEIAASLLVTAPADPRLPLVAEAFGAMVGSEPAAAAALRPVGTSPATVVFEHVGYREAKRRLGLLGGEDRPAEGGDEHSRNEFLRAPVPARELVGRLREDRVAGEHRRLDFSPWGGAYNRVRPDATAFVHRDDRYWLKHAAEVDAGASDAEKEAAHDWAGRSWSLVHPFGTGRVFPNFPDPDLEDWPRAYFGPNLERLRQVKARYDPQGLFRFRQSLS
jgi:FAD/FMN-containing dehydrogenase